MKVPNATEVEVYRLRTRNKELNEQVKALTLDNAALQNEVALAKEAAMHHYEAYQKAKDEIARADYATARAVERAEVLEAEIRARKLADKSVDAVVSKKKTEPKPKKLKTKKPKA